MLKNVNDIVTLPQLNKLLVSVGVVVKSRTACHTIFIRFRLRCCFIGYPLHLVLLDSRFAPSWRAAIWSLGCGRIHRGVSYKCRPRVIGWASLQIAAVLLSKFSPSTVMVHETVRRRRPSFLAPPTAAVVNHNVTGQDAEGIDQNVTHNRYVHSRGDKRQRRLRRLAVWKWKCLPLETQHYRRCK